MRERPPGRWPLIALLAGAAALAACDEEEEVAEDTPIVEVSRIGDIVWPPLAVREAGMAISEDPLAENNMVVLDMSGSMGEGGCSGDHRNRAEAAKEALFRWIAANPGDNIGLVSFASDGIALAVPLGRGEAHAERLVAEIEALIPGGGTPLASAMALGVEALERHAARQNGTGTYRLIVITDGEASSGESPRALVAEVAGNPANAIELHTIGFCIEGGHALNDPHAVFYADANSPEDLASGLEAVAGEAAAFDAGDISFEELTP